MALTTSNALKALIESLGTGLVAYRNRPPAGTLRPYVTITEEIGLANDPPEDGKANTLVEPCQIDLWQDMLNKASGDVAENYTLAPTLRRGLDGSRLPQTGSLIGTSIVYVVHVRGSNRFEEVDENIVHHAIDVDVRRQV